MKSILSLFLALAALLGTADAAAAPVRSAPVPAAQVRTVPETPAPSAVGALFAARRLEAREDVSYAEMEYLHYDPQPFYEGTDLLRRLADQGDGRGAADLYDVLYDEFLYIDTLAALAMIRYDRDFGDEDLTRENTYINTVWTDAQDALLDAAAYALSAESDGVFAAHLGPDTAALYTSYSGSDSDDEALAEELALEDEYYALYDGIDELTYSYEGEDWTLARLYGFPGEALSYRDYDAYLDVYNGLQQTLAETFAPLYIRLSALWEQTARDAGYDSYIDYAYEVVFGRDYTPADAQRLCDAVKPIAREYYGDLYYSDLAYAGAEVSPLPDGDELLATLGELLPRIDPALAEPWEELLRRGLYDVAPDAPGRFDGSYTTDMLYYRAPFMYLTLMGDCQDLISVTHEFGHFADYYFSPHTNILTQRDDLDLAEVHSNGLQALFTEFYGEIYAEGADTARFINLSTLLENVIDGCLYDEFQRRVMAEPADSLSPERLNEIYTDLCREYGVYEAREWDGSWVYISHLFSQPLYYFSYAASALAALQLWDLAQTDFPAAADTYMVLLHHGSFASSYPQAIRDSGLRLFTEEGAVEAVCRPVLTELYALDRAG